MMEDKQRDSYPVFISNKIQVSEAGDKGLGVFCIEPIEANEVIEVCPVMLLKYDKRLKWNWLKRFYKAAIVTLFDDYLWWWRLQKNALLLGYGNLYNHSENYNAEVYRGGNRRFIFVALRQINPGEEICIHYGIQPFCFENQEAY